MAIKKGRKLSSNELSGVTGGAVTVGDTNVGKKDKTKLSGSSTITITTAQGGTVSNAKEFDYKGKNK